MLHELPLGHLQSPRSFIKIIASKAVSLAASIETSTDCGYARSANRESAISDETRFGLSLEIDRPDRSRKAGQSRSKSGWSSPHRSHAARTWALRPGRGFRQDCVNRRRAPCYGDQFSLFQRKTVPVPHSGIVAPALPGTHAGSAWFPDFAAIAWLAPSASRSGPTRK